MILDLDTIRAMKTFSNAPNVEISYGIKSCLTQASNRIIKKIKSQFNYIIYST